MGILEDNNNKMKEIKWRAWNYKTKEYDYMVFDGGKIIKMVFNDGAHGDWEFYLNKKDENGNEIYSVNKK